MEVVKFTSFGDYLVNLIKVVSKGLVGVLCICSTVYPNISYFSLASCAALGNCYLSNRPTCPWWIMRIQLLCGAKVPRGLHGPITKDDDFLLAYERLFGNSKCTLF